MCALIISGVILVGCLAIVIGTIREAERNYQQRVDRIDRIGRP